MPVPESERVFAPLLSRFAWRSVGVLLVSDDLAGVNFHVAVGLAGIPASLTLAHILVPLAAVLVDLVVALISFASFRSAAGFEQTALTGPVQ